MADSWRPAGFRNLYNLALPLRAVAELGQTGALNGQEVIALKGQEVIACGSSKAFLLLYVM